MPARKMSLLQAVNAARTADTSLNPPPPPSQSDLAPWHSAAPKPRPPLEAFTLRPAAPPRQGGRSRSARAAHRPLRSAAPGPEERGASFGFRLPSEELEDAQGAILSHWVGSHAEESDRFASSAVYVEMRLKQALAASSQNGAPNLFRCAIVCDAWERVMPMLGRYSRLFSLLWPELLKCIFADYHEGLAGSDARGYSTHRPHFLEAAQLRHACKEQGATIAQWHEQREQAMSDMGERNKTIAHTLSAWNRALAGAGQASQKAQLEALAAELESANAHIVSLTGDSYAEPAVKLVHDFEALPPPARLLAFGRLLEAPGVAEALLPSLDASQGAEILTRLLRPVPEDLAAGMLAATLGGLSSAAVLRRRLLEEATPAEAGTCMGDYLSRLHARPARRKSAASLAGMRPKSGVTEGSAEGEDCFIEASHNLAARLSPQQQARDARSPPLRLPSVQDRLPSSPYSHNAGTPLLPSRTPYPTLPTISLYPPPPSTHPLPSA